MTDIELLETILAKVNEMEMKINRVEIQQQKDHEIFKNLENNIFNNNVNFEGHSKKKRL